MPGSLIACHFRCPFFVGDCPWVYLGHPVPEGYQYGDLGVQVGGVSRIATIKYGLEYRGTALARTTAAINYRPVLSSERALQNNKSRTV
jgi:hypothetical protein